MHLLLYFVQKSKIFFIANCKKNLLNARGLDESTFLANYQRWRLSLKAFVFIPNVEGSDRKSEINFVRFLHVAFKCLLLCLQLERQKQFTKFV